MTVLMGNGAFASRRSLKRFVHHMTDAATEDGRALNVVTYEDPAGSRAYAPAARAQRLGTVALHTAEQGAAPLHLVGHSWSWGDALRLAQIFDEKELPIATVTGYTPTNSPEAARLEPYVEKPRTPLMMLGSCVREVLHTVAVSRRPSLPIVSWVALNAVAHFGPETLRSCRQTLARDDSTRRAAELSHRLPYGSVGVMVARDDHLYPARATAENLLYEGFRGPIRYLDHTTHTSAVTDPSHGRDLYAMIKCQEERRQAALAQAATQATAQTQD